MLYDNFQGAVILDQIMRQNDNDFQSVLNNIGDGSITSADYNFLKTRFTTSVSKTERVSFKDSVHLFSTRLEVVNFNRERLANLKTSANERLPVARVPAIHNTKRAELGTVTEAEGLHSVLYLARGARIMLKSNLWTEKGLVNGAIGTIVDIIYEEEKNPPYVSPGIIIVRFDNYDGPYLDNDLKTVPISQQTKSWTSNSGENMTRTQFPIVLCYACSIHQSQSLTLDKVVLSIGKKEMATGI
ncbi:ATP-dependent DNA helicase, partial [Frankliniella fusca]